MRYTKLESTEICLAATWRLQPPPSKTSRPCFLRAFERVRLRAVELHVAQQKQSCLRFHSKPILRYETREQRYYSGNMGKRYPLFERCSKLFQVLPRLLLDLQEQH